VESVYANALNGVRQVRKQGLRKSQRAEEEDGTWCLRL
jgi:hypothetical protein